MRRFLSIDRRVLSGFLLLIVCSPHFCFANASVAFPDSSGTRVDSIASSAFPRFRFQPFLSILAPGFSHSGRLSVPNPFLNNPLFGLQAGVGLEIGYSRRMAARLELSYVRKGAREVFGQRTDRLEATTKLHYAQLNLMPLILKPEWKRFPVTAGFGVYGGCLLKMSHRYTVNHGAVFSNVLLSDNFRSMDFGWTLSLGYQGFRLPLELRFEAGFRPILPSHGLQTPLYNRVLALHLTI
ncbi:porin family protein [Larkinella soli]|uniref:porin family protein n=1 Tax=Larkinella soli TaxID=1770527 RepID=UPI000FFB54B0|nr:porin family protein [Larkinella soli]